MSDLIADTLENTCIPVLSEIKSAGNFSQPQMNRLAAAIRIKAGVILNPSISADNQPIADPCLECKKIADQVKVAVLSGASFDCLIRLISGII